jgi:Ca2+-binding EF-hand superfamily protein
MDKIIKIDEELKKAVYRIFNAYDLDNSGTLDVKEVHSLVTDALYHIKDFRKITEEEIALFIK